jgi:hypothetical protein
MPFLLFAICNNLTISVANARLSDNLAIRFRLSLDQESPLQWGSLAMLDENLELGTSLDKVVRHLEPSGKYSVKSMYEKLSQGMTVAHFQEIWEAKVPLKIKLFSWQLVLDKLPSSLQIATRHGPTSGACALCIAPEDASLIFFTCSLAKFAWSALR